MSLILNISFPPTLFFACIFYHRHSLWPVVLILDKLSWKNWELWEFVCVISSGAALFWTLVNGKLWELDPSGLYTHHWEQRALHLHWGKTAALIYLFLHIGSVGKSYLSKSLHLLKDLALLQIFIYFYLTLLMLNFFKVITHKLMLSSFLFVELHIGCFMRYVSKTHLFHFSDGFGA